MYNFDRMIVQAEIDYRGEKMQRGTRVKRRNRFMESHRQPVVMSAADAKRTR